MCGLKFETFDLDKSLTHIIHDSNTLSLNLSPIVVNELFRRRQLDVQRDNLQICTVPRPMSCTHLVNVICPSGTADVVHGTAADSSSMQQAAIPSEIKHVRIVRPKIHVTWSQCGMHTLVEVLHLVGFVHQRICRSLSDNIIRTGRQSAFFLTKNAGKMLARRTQHALDVSVTNFSTSERSTH